MVKVWHRHPYKVKMSSLYSIEKIVCCLMGDKRLLNKASEHLDLKYRPDIDGLRAIAVLLVLFFHGFPKSLKGGFIGVDIFFVISGYLISSIILSDLQAKDFSISRFYYKRVRRIFPALLVVMGAAVILGVMFLLPEDLERLAKHISAGSVFLSNFVLYSEDGYFDVNSTAKPLLHLWSLAIEEQFYIVWPILLSFLYKKTKHIGRILVGLFVVSLILSIYTNHTNKSLAFFAPHTRAWELLLGALIAHYESTKLISWDSILRRSSLAGIALIFAGAALASEKNFSPYWALLPVLGTGLIIQSRRDVIINRILSQKIFVYIGKLSYPLYLWHWPLLSFAWLIDIPHSKPIIYAILAASFVLSWATYRWVEQPFRQRQIRISQVLMLSSSMIFVGYCGYRVFLNQGIIPVIGNFNKMVKVGDIGAEPFLQYYKESFFSCSGFKRDISKKYEECLQSQASGPASIVLMGDSHAQHLFAGLARALPEQNIIYLDRWPMPLTKDSAEDAQYWGMISNPSVKTVIVSVYWGLRLERFSGTRVEFIEELKAAFKNIPRDKQIFAFYDNPSFSFQPGTCKYDRWYSIHKCSEPEKSFIESNSIVNKIFSGKDDVINVNLAKYFCKYSMCTMADETAIYYRDDNHFNIIGSLYVGKELVRDYFDNFKNE